MSTGETYDILLNLYNPLVNSDPMWYEQTHFVYHMPRAQTYSLAPLVAWLIQISPAYRSRMKHLKLCIDARLLQNPPWWCFSKKTMTRREFEKSVSSFTALWRENPGLLREGDGLEVVLAPRAGEEGRQLGGRERERSSELEQLIRDGIERAKHGEPIPSFGQDASSVGDGTAGLRPWL